MRRAAIVTILTALLAPTVAHAKDLPTVVEARPNQDVLSLCRTFPTGGEAMAKTVTDLLVGDPKLADEFARLSRSCNCDQAAAIALGVSRATTELQKTAAAAIKPMYETLTGACAPVTCPRLPYSRKRVENAAPATGVVSGEPAEVSGPSAPLTTASLPKPIALMNRTAAAAARDVTPQTVVRQEPSPKPQDGSLSSEAASAGKAAANGKLQPSRDDRCEVAHGDKASGGKRRQVDLLKIREPQGQDCFCALISSLATQAFAQGDAGERIGFFPDEGGFTGGGASSDGIPVTSN